MHSSNRGKFYCSQDGNFLKPSVAEGDRVFLPEFGGTKIEVDSKVSSILKCVKLYLPWKRLAPSLLEEYSDFRLLAPIDCVIIDVLLV